MRMLLFCAALLFPSLALGQGTLTRQGYTGGTPSLGGCTGLTANDTSVVQIGQCIKKDTNSSIWINDCWSNGVVSFTSYNGSSTCDPAFASSLGFVGSTIAGSSGPSYCNVDFDDTPVTYDTYQCSQVTPTPTTVGIQVNVYAKAFGATGCSGALAFNPPQVVPSGVCTQLTGTGIPTPDGSPNPPLYVLASCANGLVSSVIYATSNCSVLFNATGFIVPGSVSPFGPFAQVNATSAVGKKVGARGSACAVNDQAYISYSCVTITPATTAPTTPATTAPTTPATQPPTNNTGNPTTVMAGTATGTTVAVILMAVAAAQLL